LVGDGAVHSNRAYNWGKIGTRKKKHTWGVGGGGGAMRGNTGERYMVYENKNTF